MESFMKFLLKKNITELHDKSKRSNSTDIFILLTHYLNYLKKILFVNYFTRYIIILFTLLFDFNTLIP